MVAAMRNSVEDAAHQGKGRRHSRPASDGAVLSARYAFGVTGPVRDNVGFVMLPDTSVADSALSLEHLVHPVGQQLALYRIEDGSMQFFTGKARNVREVLAMAVAPNKRTVAVCERTDEPGTAQVSVYHVANCKRIRTLTHPMRGDFVSCCFSGDSKLLAAVGAGEGDTAQIVVWSWEQSRVVRSSGGTAHHSGSGARATRVCFNPDNSQQLTTSGPCHLRIWYATPDGVAKVHSLLPASRDKDTFADHAWLKGSSSGTASSGLAAGGRSGQIAAAQQPTRMVAITDGEGVRDSRGASILIFDSVPGHPFLELRQMIAAALPGSTRLETVCPHSKGFLVAGGGVAAGFLGVYEASDERRSPYMLIKNFAARGEVLGCLAVAKGGDTAVAYARSGRLLTFPLGAVDALEEAGEHFTPLITGGTHSGAVVALDAAAAKPLLATVGTDRKLRVWNYLRWRCDVVHDFKTEEPSCVALQPTGYALAVGFKDRIRMYHLLATGLRTDRELAAKNVRALRYSHGGHLLAAAAGFSVTVYSTLTGALLHTFAGHIAPVRVLAWASGDAVLYSTGTDGNVYGWDTRSGGGSCAGGSSGPQGDRGGTSGGSSSAAGALAAAAAASGGGGSRIDRCVQLNRAQPYGALVMQLADKRDGVSTVVAVGPSDGFLRECTWRGDGDSSSATATAASTTAVTASASTTAATAGKSAAISGAGDSGNSNGGAATAGAAPTTSDSGFERTAGTVRDVPLHATAAAATAAVINSSSSSSSIGGSSSSIALNATTSTTALAAAAAAAAADTEHVTALALSHDCRTLFAGMSGGCVRAYAWPLAAVPNPPYADLQVHAGAVADLRVSPDDAFVFSAGEDGAVFVLAVTLLERGIASSTLTATAAAAAAAAAVGAASSGASTGGARRNISVGGTVPGTAAAAAVVDADPRAFNLEAVLVSLEEVEEAALQLAELRKGADDARGEAEYALHRKAAEWAEEARAMAEDKDALLQAKDARYEELHQRHEASVRAHAEELERKDLHHVQVTQELENQYEHRLAVELDRYDKLSEKLEASQQRCEGLLSAQSVKHDRDARERELAARHVERELRLQIERLQEDKKYNDQVYRSVLDQQEGEYERELQQVMTKAEAELTVERENTGKLQQILEARRTNEGQLKKRMQEVQRSSAARDMLYALERGKREKLEATMHHFEEHMHERELTLAEKERAILDLRSNNLTLDNFRFVLDHRLQQLMEERGPITRHIEGLEAHIRAMYDELVSEFREKKEVARVLEQRELKAGGLAQEITTLRAMLRARERVIFGFKRDVASLAHHISAPKDLEAAVTGLYKKFVQSDELTGTGASATAGAGRSSSKGASKSGKAAKSGTATSTAGATGTAAAANNDAASAASSDSEDEDRLRAARRQRSTAAVGTAVDAAGARRSGSGNNANNSSSGSGGQQAGGSELQEQALEAHRQREFMEKRQSELRAKLAGAARTAAKRDRAKLGENAVLIAECNALRKENIALRRAGDALRQVLKETRHGGATTVSSAAGAGDATAVGSTLGIQSKRKSARPTVNGSDSPNGSLDPLDDSMQWREDTGGASSAGGNRLQVTNGRPQAVAASSGTDSYDRSGSATAAAAAATAAAGVALLRESSSASALLLPSRSGSRRGLAHTPGASELAMSPTGVVRGGTRELNRRAQGAGTAALTQQLLDAKDKELLMQRTEIHRLRARLASGAAGFPTSSSAGGGSVVGSLSKGSFDQLDLERSGSRPLFTPLSGAIVL